MSPHEKYLINQARTTQELAKTLEIERDQLRAEVERLQAPRVPLTGEQIETAVRPLYANSICAELALREDIDTARAIERACAEAWGIILVTGSEGHAA